MPTSAADPTASRMEEEVLRLARHGSFRAAADVCRALNAKHPQFAPGWRAASGIALQMGDAAAALTLIDRALQLTPKDGRSLLQKAHVLRALHRQNEAFEIANQVRPLLNGDAAALDLLGTFYSLCGEQRLALRGLRSRAPAGSAQYPDHVQPRHRPALPWPLTGAEEDYNHVIAGRPNDYEAYKNRSDLRKQTRERNHVAALEGLLKPGITDWRGEVQIRYALAKELRGPRRLRSLVDATGAGRAFTPPTPEIRHRPRCGDRELDRRCLPRRAVTDTSGLRHQRTDLHRGPAA